MNTMTPAERKLRNARAHVVQSHPFFGQLLLRQSLVETDRVETMATDGDRLYFNPAFVEAKSMSELRAVCAHEALHPGMLHHVRRGDRDPRGWNVACDFAINPILREARFELPPDALLDDRYLGMNAEQIYATFPAIEVLLAGLPGAASEGTQGDGQAPDDGSGDGDGDGEPERGPGERSYGGMGSVMDAPGRTERELQAEAGKWKVAVAQAALAAAGRLPASLKAAIEGVLEPRVDWRERLWRFAQQVSRDDYSWRTPNRRFVGQGLYLPALRSEKLGPGLFVTDSSGSMSDEALRQAVSEVEAIVERIRPERLDVVVADARVHTVRQFEPGEPVEVEVVGRGGTAFRPVCDWIAEQAEDYAFLIWFTDMYPCDWEAAAELPPEAPLIWVDYGDSRVEPPFGDEVVRMPA